MDWSMSKINIAERDLSWYYRQRGEGSMTVLVPGMSSFGPTDRPVLCDSSNFSRVYGGPVPNVVDLSYNMAASFIKAGFNVLFYRFVDPSATTAEAQDITGEGTSKLKISAKYPGSYGSGLSVKIKAGTSPNWYFFVYDKAGILLENLVVNFADPTNKNYYSSIDTEFINIKLDGEWKGFNAPADAVKLSGGTDGSDAATIKSNTRAEIIKEGAFSDLLDPYQYTFDLISAADWCDHKDLDEDSREKVDVVLGELAYNRGTAEYFIDGDKDSNDPAEQYQYCGLFDSYKSHVTGVGPWGYAQLLSNGQTALLPGSYAMLVQWAQSCSEGVPAWMAPAGVKRASLGSFYRRPKYEIGKTTLDMWQNHDYVEPNGYKVIPIMKAKQYGYVVYGNSTLLKNSGDGSTSMLQSLSTRILCNLIKNKAFDVSLSLQFDQMTDDLFSQFKTVLGTYMDTLRYGGALYDYEIVLDSTTVTRTDLNERTVPVIIRISPNPTADNFDITLEISQAGVTFTDDTDENEVG